MKRRTVGGIRGKVTHRSRFPMWDSVFQSAPSPAVPADSALQRSRAVVYSPSPRIPTSPACGDAIMDRRQFDASAVLFSLSWPALFIQWLTLMGKGCELWIAYKCRQRSSPQNGWPAPQSRRMYIYYICNTRVYMNNIIIPALDTEAGDESLCSHKNAPLFVLPWTL